MIVQLLTPARKEFLEAAEFYESEAPGLGADFIDEFERAIELPLIQIAKIEDVNLYFEHPQGICELLLAPSHLRRPSEFLQDRIFGCRYVEPFSQCLLDVLSRKSTGPRGGLPKGASSAKPSLAAGFSALQ